MKFNCKFKKLDTHTEVALPTGETCLIDHSDEYLMDVFPSWQSRRGYVGCERWIKTDYGSVLQRIYLHKAITGWDKKWQVDHANRNKMDNRKANLRMATASQNSANSVRTTRSNTGYRGVTDTQKKQGRNLRKRFVLNFGGRNFGYFYSAEVAAMVYDKYALKKYGPFAVLNFENEWKD